MESLDNTKSMDDSDIIPSVISKYNEEFNN